MADLDLIFFAAFVAVLAVLVYADRKKVKLQGIMFIRRTEKGKRFIDSIAKGHPGFWNAMSYAGIIVAIIALLAGFAFLFSNVQGILRGEVREGVRFVLPYPSGEAQFHPGLLLLPWWVWIIAIFSVVVPHEFFHGIMCRLHNIRIKSLGWLLLVIIPGAFVEPDERQLKRAPRKVKLKVYAAGSFANILVAAAAGIIVLSFSVFYVPAGILPSSLVKDSPAEQAGMKGAVLSIDGRETKSLEGISSVLEKIPPGTEIAVKTTSGEYKVTTAANPDNPAKSFLGISGPFSVYADVPPAYSAFAGIVRNARELLLWIFVLNLGIGIVNILPIKPLDGGLLFEEISGKFFRKNALVVKAVSGFTLFLLLFNIFGPMLV